jgi:hypothetical protein
MFQNYVHFPDVRYQVLTAASVMFRAVFWVILPCKMIVDRRFRCNVTFVLGNINKINLMLFIQLLPLSGNKVLV